MIPYRTKALKSHKNASKKPVAETQILLSQLS